MFDHVKFGVSDYAASKAFFLEALQPLGLAVVSEGPPTYGVELSAKGKASLCLYQTEEKPAHLHLAFIAENRQQVEAFHRAALAAGGVDEGPPGPRPDYGPDYYGAFVRDLDGNKLEAVLVTEPAGRAEAKPKRKAATGGGGKRIGAKRKGAKRKAAKRAAKRTRPSSARSKRTSNKKTKGRAPRRR